MKKSIILICSIILIFIIISEIYSFLMPKIVLKGKNEVTINYNSKYKEYGYSAKYRKRNLTNKVKVSGKVNTKKIGNYTIIYKVRYKGMTTKVKRLIKVRDIIKPKISIKPNSLYTCPGTVYNYNSIKYKAFDNLDKHITDKLIIIKRGDSATFSVSDSSNNTKSVSRKIHYKDNTPPKLKLLGKENQVLYKDEEYKEKGYIVSDNCDKDIKDKVGVEGYVDTSKLGTYTLTYSVKDKYGNKTVKKRTVSVISKDGKGVVYLTFDDGPQAGTTDVILDILKEEGIKATFFVTNYGPDDLIKREYDEGHTIALHTATHNYEYVYSSVENYFNDLQSVHDRVKNITGYDANIIRFPGGSSNTISRRFYPGIMTILTTEVLNRGYKYCDWNILSGDAGDTNIPEEIYQRVTTNLSHDNINIVLMHDIKPYTRDALRNIIRYGKDNGYVFDRLNYNGEMVTQRVNN